MALPSPNHLSQRYLERCLENQRLANFHTIHHNPARGHHNHQWNGTKTLPHPRVPIIDLSPTQPPPRTQDDPEEIHITRVDFLKEWIDISELPTGRENQPAQKSNVRHQMTPQRAFNVTRPRVGTPEIPPRSTTLEGLPQMFNVPQERQFLPVKAPEGPTPNYHTIPQSGSVHGQPPVLNVQRPTIYVTPRVLKVTTDNHPRKAILIVRQRVENPVRHNKVVKIFRPVGTFETKIEINDDEIEEVCEEFPETVTKLEDANMAEKTEDDLEIKSDRSKKLQEVEETQLNELPRPIPEVLSEKRRNHWADLNVVEDPTQSAKPQELEDPPKKRPKYKCDHCPYKTKWKNNMTKHVICRHQSHEEINWFQCAHCLYKGKTREHLRAHLRTNHEQFFTWYQCKHCTAKYRNRETLRHHVVVKHTPEDAVKWFKCDKCDYKSRNKRNFNVHVMLRHTDKKDIVWFQCHSCDYQGKTKVSLRRHVKNMHTGVDKTVWHSCYRCGIRMTKVKAFNLHEKECKAAKKKDDVYEFPISAVTIPECK